MISHRHSIRICHRYYEKCILLSDFTIYQYLIYYRLNSEIRTSFSWMSTTQYNNSPFFFTNFILLCFLSNLNWRNIKTTQTLSNFINFDPLTQLNWLDESQQFTVSIRWHSSDKYSFSWFLKLFCNKYYLVGILFHILILNNYY